MDKEVILVDLDGTLAHYDHWRGIEHIGKPILPMLLRIRSWLRQGKIVKIFTARVEEPKAIPYIKEWLEDHDLGELEVTNVKTFDVVEIYDDRAIQIEQNTGRRIDGKK